jgi:hypothetical protein
VSGEKHFEHANELSERYACQRSTKSDQRGPKDNAGKIFVPEQDEPQAREQG